MTEDLNITIRPSSGPSRSPEDIAKFYSTFDGWQEILPKTDNTYSPGSKYYKYEVSPGIPFIPNMSRPPLKSYEKTPVKLDFSEDQTDYIFTSSYIKKKLFTSTSYKHYKVRTNNNIQTEVEETLITSQSKISKTIINLFKYVTIFIKFIVSCFISIFTLTEIHESVMEIGSNIINTSIQKITNWVHIASITMVHYDLILITTIRKIFDHYFGNTRNNSLLIPILFTALILFLTVGIVMYITPFGIVMWQDSWTNFLISPFINILNLITSIYQIFFSTLYFILDLITLTFASSIVVINLFGQLFLNVFRNINTVVDSASQVNTLPVNEASTFLPFDYNMLARKVIASEDFQRLIINQLNISQSDLARFQKQELQQLLKIQFEQMNFENLNLINDQLKTHQILLQNINKEISDQEKETIQLMEKKILVLQDSVLNLINNFETYKSNLDAVKTSTELVSKKGCVKDDWNSIVNYIEQYVNMTMKSTLSTYDADKTGMVDYALESAGATVLGTRCTQTKPSTAALTMFGIPLWFISNGPRVAIQPDVNPGNCWAFIGSKGFLVLKLSKTIQVTGFTIEHLPKSLSENGQIKSAPKDFSIWGLKHETDSNGKLLGKYQFKVDGPSLQYFSSVGKKNVFSIVELRIESNHGHEEYTCLYRIRVHGDLELDGT